MSVYPKKIWFEVGQSMFKHPVDNIILQDSLLSTVKAHLYNLLWLQQKTIVKHCQYLSRQIVTPMLSISSALELM